MGGRPRRGSERTRAVTNEDDWVCGESYDHDLRLVGESGGQRTYECGNCGAEIWEEDDDDE